MASARFRKPFQYPADNSDDDDTPRDLDEEEQEKLIRKLKEEDEERNEEYKRLFLAIPTIAATSYIPALIVCRLLQIKLVSLLCIASLITTAYILIFVPNGRSAQSSSSSSVGLAHEAPSGPLRQYIGVLNGGLSLILSLNAYILKDKRGVHEGFWLLCLLPATTFAIIMLAKRLMLSVDVGELESLKYRYKGA